MTELAIRNADDVAVPDETDSPWAVAVKAWLAAQLKEATVRAYRTDEHQWRVWCTARGLDPFRVVRAHVDTYAGHLRASGGYNGRPAAPKTVARKLAALSSLYEYLVDEGLLTHSPVAHVKRPKVASEYAATVSLDEGQVRAVIAAARAESDVAHALVLTLVLTGVRSAEALNADVTHLVDDHGHRCLNVVRKGGGYDRVVLHPAAAHALTVYVGDRTSGPLFLHRGDRFTYSALSWLLERLGRAAGLPATLTLHPHMLRASFATISFDRGARLDRIQDALGHADPRTTRLYDRGRGRLSRKAEPGALVARYVLDAD